MSIIPQTMLVIFTEPIKGIDGFLLLLLLSLLLLLKSYSQQNHSAGVVTALVEHQHAYKRYCLLQYFAGKKNKSVEVKK